MASVKPSVPKGTRDFSPAEMAKRNYIFDTIKSVFRKYGYQQIETPAMENLSTLMGKYGDEGDGVRGAEWPQPNRSPDEERHGKVRERHRAAARPRVGEGFGAVIRSRPGPRAIFSRPAPRR